MASRNTIQSHLISYLHRFGSIDLNLPDGMGLEIGITQEGKRGYEKKGDYCWVVTRRDTRSSTFDRYSMELSFEDESKCIVDDSDVGSIYVI